MTVMHVKAASPGHAGGYFLLYVPPYPARGNQNSVCSEISVEIAVNARSMNLRCICFCWSAGRSISLQGLLIVIPGTMRLLPVTWAIGGKAVIWTMGMPALSISFTIVAPQRVQLPHVLTKIAPSTCSAWRTWAISRPMRWASFRKVRLPVVE